MKLAKFKNHPAVINLTWHALPADQSERSAIKAILEQNKGVKAGVVVKYGGVTLMGLGPVGAKVVSGPSAAAWLSMANQKAMDQSSGNVGLPNTGSGSTNDWIVVENMGDGTFWLAIIRDGVPLPGTDVSLDRETTLELIQEAVETAPFVVYSPDEGIRGDVPAGTMVDSKGFSDLVQGVKPGKFAMRTITGVSIKLLAGIGLVLLLGMAWMGYSYYAEQREMKRMQAASAAAAAAQQKQMTADKADYTLKVKQAILTALDKGASDLNISLSRPSANESISGWISLIADTSINQNGWDITSFTCSTAEDATPSCVVSMTRGAFSTNRILMEDHPDAILDGDNATFTIKGQAPSSRQGSYKTLERSDSFNLDFVSDLQMLKFASVNYNIAESKDVTAAITMPPVPASIFKPGDTAQAVPSPAPIKMGVASGDLTFTGTELWQAEGLREFLDRSNIVVQSMEMAVSDLSPGAWTIKAMYYIRNAPEPILPAVIGPDKEAIQVSLPEKYKASPDDLATWSSAPPVAASASAPPVVATTVTVQDENATAIPGNQSPDGKEMAEQSQGIPAL